jgi:hypothetical protein
VDGFKPAKYGVAEHARTGYPLLGKHISVRCEACHIPAGKATLYHIKFAQCNDCHKDVHAAQFAAAPNLDRCENCHTVQGFQPSTFTLARHKSSRFPLAGSHVAVACGDCHKPLDELAVKKVARYRFEDRTCTECHVDPHRGQFRERMLKAGSGGKAAGCETCHSLSSWKELSKFDHASTEYPLVGAHRAVACADCHRPPNLETTLVNVNFQAAPKLCEECHKDPHGAQFAINGKPTQCAPCHNTVKWKPSLFDHNTRTKFALEGVHKNVRCVRCHSTVKLIDDTGVLFYKPTPVECVACHGPNVPPMPSAPPNR